MNSAHFSMLVAFLIILSKAQTTTCDFSLRGVSIGMESFTTRAYQTPVLNLIFDRLNNLRATILTQYQMCYNKLIPDPDALYPQDISQCLMGLFNTSALYAKYTGQYPQIKADVDKIAKVVFSTQNNCRPVLNYRGWTNISDQCKDGAKDLDDILVKYGNDIVLGKNGTNYIPDMLLAVQKQRKMCGFNILNKPKRWNADNCQSANLKWLYPISDQIDTIIQNKNYLNYTAYFYLLYQSVYEAYAVCNSKEQSFIDSQLFYNQTNKQQLDTSLTKQVEKQSQKNDQGDIEPIIINRAQRHQSKDTFKILKKILPVINQ